MDIGNNKVLLLVLVLVVVVGIAVGVYFLTAGSGDLSKEQADAQCVQCIQKSCPPTPGDAINPLKTCSNLVAIQQCGCSGNCEPACRQANAYDPNQCAKLFCSVGRVQDRQD